MLYLCRVKPLRHYLRGFLIAAWAGDKIAEFSFPEISFHFPLRPWFFFVSPAYAGKRAPGTATTRRRRDHPRVCGEKMFCASASVLGMGSPPRMRGKGYKFLNILAADGITPAYAGKRSGQFLKWHFHWDHPRVCGEKRERPRSGAPLPGSPPRMRGKVVKEVTGQTATRITPAYAGKSSDLFCCSGVVGDHPRVCGEKNGSIDNLRDGLGSPPRMRGKD